MLVEGAGDLPGKLVVVSGPSGCGKSTIIRRALQHPDLRVELSISATTRAPRPHERDGIDYYFIEKTEFVRKVNNRDFLEWVEYNENYYGTPGKPVYEALKVGKTMLLEIEVHGAEKVCHTLPSALFVFVKTPNFHVLEKRLINRGTESEAVILNRLRTARFEVGHASWYEHQLVNDDLDRCVEEFVSILKSYGSGG